MTIIDSHVHFWKYNKKRDNCHGSSNGSAPTAENLYMAATFFFQQIFHVLEEFDMTTLVTGDGNSMSIFLNSTIDNLCNRAIVTKMNDLGTLALHDAPHNIDGSVMAVKQRGSRYNSDLAAGNFTHNRKWVFKCSSVIDCSWEQKPCKCNKS